MKENMKHGPEVVPQQPNGWTTMAGIGAENFGKGDSVPSKPIPEHSTGIGWKKRN